MDAQWDAQGLQGITRDAQVLQGMRKQGYKGCANQSYKGNKGMRIREMRKNNNMATIFAYLYLMYI